LYFFVWVPTIPKSAQAIPKVPRMDRIKTPLQPTCHLLRIAFIQLHNLKFQLSREILRRRSIMEIVIFFKIIKKELYFQDVNTVFRWNYGGNEVYVTGTFTNWENHVKLQKAGNEFSAILALPKGVHRYKFIVDDEWRFSPDDNNSPDENGYINNIIDTSDYNGQTSFNYPGKSSIGTSFKFLNNNASVNNRGTATLSIDNRTSMTSSVDTMKTTKFFEDEMEFVKEAPLIPPQLLDIYFISVMQTKQK